MSAAAETKKVWVKCLHHALLLSSVLMTQPSHGSLVVTVPTRDGLVICADKRRWNKVQGNVDDEVKLFQLGPKAAFAVVGYRSILSDRDFSVLFDVAQAPLRFFKQFGVENIDDSWDDLQEAVLADYRLYFERGGSFFSTEYLEPDGTLYLLMFYYADDRGIHIKKSGSNTQTVPNPRFLRVWKTIQIWHSDTLRQKDKERSWPS